MKITDISNENLAQLEQRAIDVGCTVNDLIGRLLSSSTTQTAPDIPDERDHLLRIQRKLEDLNQRLEFKAEGARIAWWEMDPVSGKVSFDPRKVIMAGYDPKDFEDVTYHTFTNMVHPDDYEPMMQEMLDLMEGRKPLYEIDYRLRRADGGWIWFFDRGQWAQALDGRQVIQGFVLDITRRKITEQALRESEMKARALLDAIPDSMFRLSRDGVLLDFKVSADGEFFPAADGIIGEKLDTLVSSEFAAMLMESVHQALNSGEMQIMEHQLITLQGLRDYEIRMVISGDDEVTVILQDITRRKQLQQYEIAITLEKERLRLLTEFIQNAAHEFRTPLSVINTSADLISRADDPDHRLLKAVQIQQQVDRTTKLIDMLLTMVKLESLNTLERLTAIIQDIVTMACTSVRHAYPDGPSLHLADLSHLPAVSADSALLKDAIQQILDNAHRFTSSDGSVTISGGVQEETLWLEIRDTGPGISPENLNYIFDTFWRHDIAHSTPGMGLGLTIARKIINLHGGKITVDSTVGQGSAFRIHLPLSTDNAMQ